METEPNIIIIGAGPCGLVAALTLLQEGQKVAIYDALPKGQNGSRAAAVHAHTIEVTFRSLARIEFALRTNTTIYSNFTHWDMQSNSSQRASRDKA